MHTIGSMEITVLMLAHSNAAAGLRLAGINLVENKGEARKEEESSKKNTQKISSGLPKTENRSASEKNRQGHGHHELAQMYHIRAPEKVLRKEREGTT
jgi:hypothetical protein